MRVLVAGDRGHMGAGLSARYVRLHRIQELQSAGLIDANLRRTTHRQFPAPGSHAAAESR